MLSTEGNCDPVQKKTIKPTATKTRDTAISRSIVMRPREGNAALRGRRSLRENKIGAMMSTSKLP